MAQKIMVVEDDADTRRLLVVVLEKAGYEVIGVENATEAIRQAMRQHLDLILMDVMMPGIDGFEATRELKAQPATARIPIVILTALNTLPVMKEGWGAGTDLYLEKPLGVEKLVAYVDSILKSDPLTA